MCQRYLKDIADVLSKPDISFYQNLQPTLIIQSGVASEMGYSVPPFYSSPSFSFIGSTNI
jgi:hypothetical protein